MNIKGRKYISVEDALKICEERFDNAVTKVTMYNWCAQYGIGMKIFGRWKVDKEKLIERLDGDVE
jgi:hypothetical protein